MVIDDLDVILSEGENYTVEFKRSPDKDLPSEVCAFANASGGKIYIGIHDDGYVIGTDTNNRTRSQIKDTVYKVEPRLNVSIEVFDNIVVLTVPEGTQKPYMCPDGFFLRMGPNSQKLDRDSIIAFLQTEGKVRFDSLINEEYPITDHFNDEAYLTFLMKCEISDVLPRESMLKNLSCAGVGRDGGLSYTNAGLLFFRDNRQNLYFDFTHVICALYKGTDKVDIIDAKHFDGSIMENIDNAMVFLKRNLRVRYEIKTLQRKNILELPEDALREAVTNAVCHRDYFEKGSRVMVEIFDDRVEVTNPGGAPKGITEDNFGSVSITRNPIIASLLHRAHYIERMGTGIGRIRNAAKEANVAEPVFELNHFFKVTFKRNELSISISSQLTPDRYNVDTSDTTHVTDNAGNSAYGGINSTDGSLNGGISIACGGLNNGNRAIVLGILKNEPTVTMADISRHASIPVRTVERIMAALKKDGLVERAGSKKSGYWLVLSE